MDGEGVGVGVKVTVNVEVVGVPSTEMTVVLVERNADVVEFNAVVDWEMDMVVLVRVLDTTELEDVVELVLFVKEETTVVVAEVADVVERVVEEAGFVVKVASTFPLLTEAILTQSEDFGAG